MGRGRKGSYLVSNKIILFQLDSFNNLVIPIIINPRHLGLQ